MLTLPKSPPARIFLILRFCSRYYLGHLYSIGADGNSSPVTHLHFPGWISALIKSIAQASLTLMQSLISTSQVLQDQLSSWWLMRPYKDDGPPRSMQSCRSTQQVFQNHVCSPVLHEAIQRRLLPVLSHSFPLIWTSSFCFL